MHEVIGLHCCLPIYGLGSVGGIDKIPFFHIRLKKKSFTTSSIDKALIKMCAYVLPSLCLVVALIELDNSIFKNFDLNLTDVHCLQVSLIIRNLKRKYNIFTLDSS